MNEKKNVVRALNEGGRKEDEALLAAIEGREYLYGLPIPGTDPEHAIKRWAAIESLHKAAARNMASSGTVAIDDLVQEMYGLCESVSDPLDRLTVTAERLNRVAVMKESMQK